MWPARIWLPIVLAFIATGPAWLRPAVRFVGRAEGEIRDHAWIAWLVQHRIWDGHALPLSFTDAGFPRGIALYPLDPLNQIALTAMTPIIGLAPSLLVLTTLLLALSGIAAGRLADALGVGPTRAAAVAVVTMMGPPILGSFVDGQTEGMASCWALFALATLLDPAPWTGKKGVQRGLLLGLQGAALIASAPYQAHAWTLAGGLLIVGLIVRKRLPLRSLVSLAVLVPVGLLCGNALQGAESGRNGQLTARTRSGDWPPRTMAIAASLPPIQPQLGVTPTTVNPWPREARFLPPTTGPRRWSGYALPALALFAGAWSLRKRGFRPAAVWALIGGAALYAAIAAGSARDFGSSTPFPFDLWYRHYPLGSIAWKPQQYAVPAWQLASVAMGFLPVPVAIGAALLIALEVQLSSPVRLPLPALQFEPQRWMTELQEEDAGAVLEFPARARAQQGAGRMPYDELLAQTVHEQPIGDPFGRGENAIYQNALDSLGRAAGWMVPPRAPNVEIALSVVAHAGFKTLVVHAEGMSTAEESGVRSAVVPLLGEPRDVDGVWVWSLATMQ